MARRVYTLEEAAAEMNRLRQEVERLTAINANLMGDDEDAPRYTTKRLHHEIKRARRQAFVEAVEIAEAENMRLIDIAKFQANETDVRPLNATEKLREAILARAGTAKQVATSIRARMAETS